MSNRFTPRLINKPTPSIDAEPDMQYVSVKDAAEQMCVCAATIRRLCAERRLTHIAIPGKKKKIIRIPQSALNTFFKEHTHAGQHDQEDA